MDQKIVFFAAIILSALSSQAQAATLNADGAWHAFDVDESVASTGGLEWIDLDGNALSFDFTLTRAAILKVVDAGFAGDRFTIFNDSEVLGQTSIANSSYPDSVGLDFDAAYADANYSRAEFLLGPGSYSINGWLSQSSQADGLNINATVGAVSLTAVPLPAAAWLYMTGAACIGWSARRRNLNV